MPSKSKYINPNPILRFRDDPPRYRRMSSHENYHQVYAVDGDYRLARIRMASQWVVQKRTHRKNQNDAWRSISYATTRSGLLRTIFPEGSREYDKLQVNSSILHAVVLTFPEKINTPWDYKRKCFKTETQKHEVGL